METALEAHSGTARQTLVADSGIPQWKLPLMLTVEPPGELWLQMVESHSGNCPGGSQWNSQVNRDGRWWNHTVETALKAHSGTGRQTLVADIEIAQWKLPWRLTVQPQGKWR